MEIFNQLESVVDHGLSRIDVEFCRFLKQKDRYISQEVLLAGAIASHYYNQGNVCVSLQEAAGKLFFESEGGKAIHAPELERWLEELHKSSLVGPVGEYRPLILDSSDRLYLYKSWYYEYALAQNLLSRTSRTTLSKDEELLVHGLNKLFGTSDGGDPDWQRTAAASALLHRLTIISGGPGTGKTSTVIRILALFLEQGRQSGKMPSIALAAPTGKAAARLKESIRFSREKLDVDEDIRSSIPGTAVTLHQLLGARRYSNTLKFDKDNPLPYDVVIVDEASMIDQALMSKLLEALLEDTHLILLGDKDQLASVEAGAVMGDICAPTQNQLSVSFADTLSSFSMDIPTRYQVPETESLTDHIFLLTHNYRFDQNSGIAKLAKAVNNGDEERAFQVLSDSLNEDVELIAVSDPKSIFERLETVVMDFFPKIMSASSVVEAFEILNKFRILAAHRKGPWGVETLNAGIERILYKHGFASKYDEWYTGKAVIINRNNYALNLFNGDIGLCFPDKEGRQKVFFYQDGLIRDIAPGRLPDCSLAYSLTVHKSQGSEFERVLLILPEASSRVLTRELLYTAITRAASAVEIIGAKPVLSLAIQTPAARASGLKDLLWS